MIPIPTMGTLIIVFLIVLLLGVVVGIVILQIFLSKKESKWAGLILPIISLGFALLMSVAILLFSAGYATSTVMVDGEIVEQIVDTVSEPSDIITMAVFTFLLGNIPTGILLAIYTACRGKYKKQRALNKMQAQDLE